MTAMTLADILYLLPIFQATMQMVVFVLALSSFVVFCDRGQPKSKYHIDPSDPDILAFCETNQNGQLFGKSTLVGSSSCPDFKMRE
eukprot:3539866-Rhodomonas_salina.3